MHFDVSGAGPAVLLLHGTPTGARCLAPLGEELARDHSVFLAHLPGYGETPPAPEPYSIEEVNRSLARALRDRGVTRVAAIGFSGGAYRALALALSRSIEVTGVLALAGFAGLTPEEQDGYRSLAALVRAEGSTALETIAAERMLSPRFAAAHPDAVSEVRAWIHVPSAAVLAGEFEALADAANLEPRLRELAIPIVARAGSEDHALPPSRSETLAAAARNGRFELVPGAGHALLLEDFAGTAASARAFLETIDTAQGSKSTR